MNEPQAFKAIVEKAKNAWEGLDLFP
jgi:hypothetical protein